MNKAQINKAMELADSYADARLSSWTELNVSGKRAALRAHLESCGVQASTGWIATKDQMPPEGVRVFWLDEGSNRVGYDTWCGDDYRWNTSHWMHIPPLVAQAVPQAVPDGLKWPTMPARKGQSNVLFDDGYEEGWSRCLAECSQMLAAAPQPAQAVPDAPLSFNCTNGCGACGIKLVDFVTHATQAQDGDPWVTVASEPQIVSACCGSAVEVWDERSQSTVANVIAATPHLVVSDEMVTAYLNANTAYWKQVDETPQSKRNPARWRNGTPSEATRVSLIAALGAPQPERKPLIPDYMPLQEFSEKNRVSYNELCTAVRAAIGIKE
jgi:hypothetical protein